MTSEEIQKSSPVDKSTNGWLREIAYQLALQNEAHAEETFPKEDFDKDIFTLALPVPAPKRQPKGQK